MPAAAIGLHAPSADLARVVDYYQSIEVDASPAAQETVIPAPRYSLIFQFGNVCTRVDARGAVHDYPRHFIAASTSSPVTVRLGACTQAFRVAMQPHTVEWLLQSAAFHLHDSATDMESAFGGRTQPMLRAMADAAGMEQRVQVFESWLRARMNARGMNDLQRMEHAVGRIAATAGQLKIRDLAVEMSVSERQLERWFLCTVGLGPKVYQRIARLNAVLDEVRLQAGVDWALLASHYGYADQSHLVRDFVALTGETPGACLRSAGAMRSVFQHSNTSAFRMSSSPVPNPAGRRLRTPLHAGRARVAA